MWPTSANVNNCNKCNQIYYQLDKLWAAISCLLLPQVYKAIALLLLQALKFSLKMFKLSLNEEILINGDFM